MSNNFLTDDFLLRNDVARELFHGYASQLPIIDYHNHLDPQALADDRSYASIGELWVVADPYKHRAMRINGIPEKYISGSSDLEKTFAAWAQTFPKTVGNPLYHWSVLEMKRVFGVETLLSPQTMSGIEKHCNELLRQSSYSTMGILRKWKVELLCTSDDLLDDISVHRQATETGYGITVLPSLRADSILSFGQPAFSGWLRKLCATNPVNDLEEYLHAIHVRLDAFSQAGCKLADHALDNGFHFEPPSKEVAAKLFASCMDSSELNTQELIQLKSYLLYFLAREYAERGWVMQLHIGAERFTSSRLRRLSGSTGGYATIGQACDIKSLCLFLDSVEQEGLLPKTILFTLNPADNEALATLTGSFAEDGVVGKIQFGPAWWYNDHKEGMENHLRTLSCYGLLSRFIGMTTDSRSILSFSRHEYFRRILCNYIGTLAEQKEIPDDMEFLSGLVSDLSYHNSKQFLNL